MFHLVSNKDKEQVLEKAYAPYERRLATFLTPLFSLPKTETVVDLIGELILLGFTGSHHDPTSCSLMKREFSFGCSWTLS